MKIISLDGNPLTIAIGESVYSVTVENDVDETIALQELADSVDNDDYVVTVGDSDGLLHIASVNETSSGTLVLSDNLTTTEVGSVFTFATEEYGDIYLPAGSITVITKAVTGLESITNVGTYIEGQQIEPEVDY